MALFSPEPESHSEEKPKVPQPDFAASETRVANPKCAVPPDFVAEIVETKIDISPPNVADFSEKACASSTRNARRKLGVRETRFRTSRTRNELFRRIEAENLPSEIAIMPQSSTEKVKHRALGFFERLLAPSSVWKMPWHGEEQREEAYALETLELFQRRLRLASFLGLMSVGAYASVYALLAPESAMALTGVFAFLSFVALLTFSLARHFSNIRAIRLFCLASYVLFSLGASEILLILGPNRGYITGGHSNILLSALLLPLMVHECLFIGFIAILALTFASWQTLFPAQTSLFYANIFALGNTTLFVVVIAYFQNLLRRHAFDSAFDIVISATRLQNLSVTDTLTGGYNRRHIESVLDIEMARAVRFSRPLSVLMFDLDNFKIVNDTCGHAAGDRVLIETWDTACAAIREVDTLARYGGDEFVVVLPESNEDAAQRVANRLKTNVCHKMRQRFGEDACEANVTISIGVITLRPVHLSSSAEILAQVDTQLYNAKKNGKNSIAF